MSKQTKKKTLVDAPLEQRFWVHDGPSVLNLKDLFEKLQSSVSDEQFKYHVGNDRNDFENWIREVLKDKTCATRMKRVKTKKTAIKILEKCLNEYSNT